MLTPWNVFWNKAGAEDVWLLWKLWKWWKCMTYVSQVLWRRNRRERRGVDEVFEEVIVGWCFVTQLGEVRLTLPAFFVRSYYEIWGNRVCGHCHRDSRQVVMFWNQDANSSWCFRDWSFLVKWSKIGCQFREVAVFISCLIFKTLKNILNYVCGVPEFTHYFSMVSSVWGTGSSPIALTIMVIISKVEITNIFNYKISWLFHHYFVSTTI